jgi:hypothetical protein
LLPSEFWELELRELILMREGRYRLVDKVVRELWETARFSTYHLLNIQLSKKDRLSNPTKLISFNWDRNIPAKQISPEEMEKIWNRFPDKLTGNE